MEPTADAAAPIDAPPPVPVEAAIDLKHLARMTLGERSLEAEVLRLFDRQAAVLLDHMRQAAPQAVAAFAHTLKGSARGIGAWRVAAAAETVEIEAARQDAGEVAGAVARLAVAVDEARAVIAAWLEPHICSG
ncbi:MAG TPA: Hpt domain-containing protein [Xanthobacteraceae bacterium]|jgi:HPt (histidine-containing phosphotransfer) domain-containing protein|nr:Hpt domain-containing protein [Xanthobacteraceae bacterium]